MLWKQGERVLSAGPIQVRKDFRMTLVEAASLRIANVHVSDTGTVSTYYSNLYSSEILFSRVTPASIL